MSSVLDKLRKKRGFPVEIDGEQYHVRSLTLGEIKTMGALSTEVKTGYMVACALCSGQEGAPEFPKGDGESDEAWATRVSDAISDVPTETIRALSQAVAQIGKSPSVETAAKN